MYSQFGFIIFIEQELKLEKSYTEFRLRIIWLHIRPHYFQREPKPFYHFLLKDSHEEIYVWNNTDIMISEYHWYRFQSQSRKWFSIWQLFLNEL